MAEREVTFSISEEVMEMLENRIAKEEHNDFVEKAIRSRFAMMEQEKAMKDLVIHNSIINEELDAIDAGIDLEDTFTEDDELLSDDEISDLDGMY